MMRVVYLTLGCLMLGLCALSHSLPVSHGQEPAVVEGKKPKPDKPDRPDKHDKHRHDDFKPTPAPEPGPNPEPIPPRPKPQPDPNHIHVRPLPPHVKPDIHIPDVTPHVPHRGGWLVWLLNWARTIVIVLVIGVVAIVSLIGWFIFRRR